MLSTYLNLLVIILIIAHLSHENNTPDIAISTLKDTLKEYEVDFKNIYVAKQDEKTENFNI